MIMGVWAFRSAAGVGGNHGSEPLGVPRVSIVTATYNRAEVLRFTIEAVLRSRLTDWEMIIVGDACTDHTGVMIQNFGDPRIRFVNLPVNSGEQSVPNNAGVRLARSPYVAFLNHDDLWHPDHLDLAIAHLESENADLVSTLTVAIDQYGRPLLFGSCTPEYSPRYYTPASSWVARRELLDAVGPWRRATELHSIPSMEWLFRAWRGGHELLSLQQATVLAIASGVRKNSYANSAATENASWAARLRDDPALMETLLAEIASRTIADRRRGGWRYRLRLAVRNSIYDLVVVMRLNPYALREMIRYRRKGGYLDALRATRGLAPLDRSRDGE